MFKSSETAWRIMTNLWTVLFMAFLVFDFFAKNAYDGLTTPFSAVYVGVLSLYVGTKEFDRWYEVHEKGHHPGELFVFGWTIVMVFLFAASFIKGAHYSISPDATAVYIMVLSVFALTQKSKQLYKKRRKKRR